MSGVDLHLDRDTRVGAQTVYLRQLWSDDWEPVAGLFACGKVEFCTLPAIGTATLGRRFGVGAHQGQEQLTYRERLSIANYFVKIEVVPPPNSDVGTIRWYGVVGQEELERRLAALGLPDISLP
jgi:hypothetical protein